MRTDWNLIATGCCGTLGFILLLKGSLWSALACAILGGINLWFSLRRSK
jgi:hypothetical protein